MPEDNNIKKDVLSGDIHYHDCPECGHRNFSPSPLLYVDGEKEIAIIANTYEEAIGDKIDLQEDFPGYKFYLAETPWIVTDIINAIDNNLDPLVLEFIKYDGSRYFEKKSKKYQVRNSYIAYSDDGYDLKLVLVVSDMHDNYDEKELTIDSKLYNNYVEKVEKFKSGADLSIISPFFIFTAPISIIWSPPAALNPVVSVSNTTNVLSIKYVSFGLVTIITESSIIVSSVP